MDMAHASERPRHSPPWLKIASGLRKRGNGLSWPLGPGGDAGDEWEIDSFLMKLQGVRAQDRERTAADGAGRRPTKRRPPRAGESHSHGQERHDPELLPRPRILGDPRRRRRALCDRPGRVDPAPRGRPGPGTLPSHALRLRRHHTTTHPGAAIISNAVIHAR